MALKVLFGLETRERVSKPTLIVAALIIAPHHCPSSLPLIIAPHH
jgi:hypothetical protein